MPTALFARADSVYKQDPTLDVYDIDRDARKWPGGTTVIAHPPCRAWGGLRHMAKPRPDERDLGLWAVQQVRLWGGVLEHPANSTLFPTCGLPLPSEGPDSFGGWTLAVEQFHWGHRAAKKTWLYIVGCSLENIPTVPVRQGTPTHVVGTSLRKGKQGWRPRVTNAEREHTPPALATWLTDLARRCSAPTPPLN